MGIPVMDAALTAAQTAQVAATVADTVAQTVATNVQTATATANDVAAETSKKTTWLSDKIDKIRNWVEKKRQWIQDKIDEHRWRIQKVMKWSFMFANFMRMMFQFFVIIILARMVVGFFSKPLEFIMLGISCIVLSVSYVIYYILSIPPFFYIPFLLWYVIFDIIPLIVYLFVFGVILIFVAIVCAILAAINKGTGGALQNLVLCQNSPGAWYKTGNWHNDNRYDRGLMCSRQCIDGYYPDTTGFFCVRNPKGAPSYCPQAQAMRFYNGYSDRNYYFKNYSTTGNIKYLSKSPEQRERLIKNYTLKKQEFIAQCQKHFGSGKASQYAGIPLSICSSIDVLASQGVDKKMLNKLRTVCSQAYCDGSNNYTFCQSLSTKADEDEGDFWKRVLKLIIFISLFLFIMYTTYKYIAGI